MDTNKLTFKSAMDFRTWLKNTPQEMLPGDSRLIRCDNGDSVIFNPQAVRERGAVLNQEINGAWRVI